MARHVRRSVLLGAVVAIVAFVVLLPGRESQDAAAVERVRPDPPPGSLTLRGTPVVSLARADETKAREVRVLDLSDGAPAVGLVLHCIDAEGRSSDVTVDAGGRLAGAEVARWTKVSAREPDWNVCARMDEAPPWRVIWVWRWIPVVGEVFSRDTTQALDPSRVSLSAGFAGVPGDGGGVVKVPWTHVWLTASGVPASTPFERPRDDGGFEGRMPRIQGFGLRASCEGFETTTVVVPVHAHTTTGSARIELVPCARVSGVIARADGSPFTDAEVRAYVVRSVPHDDLSAGRLRFELEEGYSASWQKDQDRATVTCVQTVRTDSEGRFDLPLRARGEVLVVAVAPGHVPLEHSLRHVDGPSPDLRLTLRAPHEPRARVPVKKGGVPLRKARILLADLTHPEVQTTYALTTDDDGAVPSEFLQTGRRYGVLYQPPVVQADASNRGFLTWDARREIDIGELERVP